MTAEVLIVGAGLAGLRCAGVLAESGIDVRVLEASDKVGGRARTDRVDGFLVDRGFQVLNPAYPAVRRVLDLPALHLASFGRGVEVRRADRTAVLVDPTRRPSLVPAMLRSGLLHPMELARLGAWLLPALGPVRALLTRPDQPYGASLDAAGVEGPLRREVLERFLAGVILESDGSTSATFVRLLLRWFARGTPGLPADGMGAMATQLAAPLGERVETGVRVHEVRGCWVTTDAGQFRADAVVVATDPRSAAALLGPAAGPVPRMKGLVTDWFATDQPPTESDLLRVEGRRGVGPVVNAAVVSNAAPSYAPSGQHLLQATSLLDEPGEAPPLERVRTHLSDLYEDQLGQLRLVARHVVREALPAQPAPLDVRRDVQVGDRLFVCGDHRDTASLEGALVSGERAGLAVRTALEAGQR